MLPYYNNLANLCRVVRANIFKPRLISLESVSFERRVFIAVSDMQNKTLFWLFSLIASLSFMIYSLGYILVPFFVGIIGAYIMNHPVSFLQVYKIPRAVGSLLAIAFVISFVSVMFTVAVPFIQNQIVLLSNNMPVLISYVHDILEPVLNFAALHVPSENIAQLKNQLNNQIGTMLSWGVQLIINIIRNGLAIANLLSLLIITPVVMFYLTKDWPSILNNIKSILPKKYAANIIEHASQVDANLSGYAKGQVIVCAILALMYAIGLSIVGLKNSILIGVITGFLSFIPYVGALIGFILSVVVHLSNTGTWNPITLIAIVFVIVQAIEGNFLTPRFIGNRIGVHPVLILFSLLAGASWFGFLGVVLALPTLATISAIARSVLHKK
jgi:predicted PurR-regulated permease PerM